VADVEAWKEGREKPQFAFRKSPAFKGQTDPMATWLRLCERDAAAVRCKPFSRARFQAALREIRSLTGAEPAEFVGAMQDQGAEAGVAVVLVPEIKGAPVSGAAKWLSPRKAMIGLNLRGKSNDRFWFSFFHEAGHLLLDSKKETYIDVDSIKDPREQQANQFAANVLIPPARAAELPNLHSFVDAEAFARSIGIAPGIVVGRLQHDGIIGFSQLNGLKTWLRWSTKEPA
jgi:HTH-type transcriptional regulator / antitoxin HigA